ncbi:hypothetical protein PanWU01x14_369820 [Parasponia andersonii]|uniref:Uncharacterized protein n=1 Tax=Parasponia andersonii TaxID=3476 RepID=A0A2P5A4H4_PARAD|nr:hypothetical protein PanWU01x14_369820 [Parasponia andersonii]
MFVLSHSVMALKDDSRGVSIEVVSFVEDDSYYVDTDVIFSSSLPDVNDGDDAYGTSDTNLANL